MLVHMSSILGRYINAYVGGGGGHVCVRVCVYVCVCVCVFKCLVYTSLILGIFINAYVGGGGGGGVMGVMCVCMCVLGGEGCWRVHTLLRSYYSVITYVYVDVHTCVCVCEREIEREGEFRCVRNWGEGGEGGRWLDVLPPPPLPPSLRQVPSSGSESRVQSNSDRGQCRLPDQTICLGQTKMCAPVVI